MEREALEHIEGLIAEEVAKRFPGAAVQRVSLLQYGDEPVIEPGELLVRVLIESPEGKGERRQTLHAFHEAHREAIEKFREDLTARLPEASRLEFLAAGTAAETISGVAATATDARHDKHGLRFTLYRPARSLEARALAGGELTPVMARLGPADLETLDTLIKAGVAPNRAEAVRWALARIRERPAYGQLRDRAREIEELKAQF